MDERMRVEEAVRLAEGALLGTEPKRSIWRDDDYLCAILAVLTGDADRARRAAIEAYRRAAGKAWLIHYEDPDRPVEIFVGEGAEQAAHARSADVGQAWTHTLFTAADKA